MHADKADQPASTRPASCGQYGREGGRIRGLFRAWFASSVRSLLGLKRPKAQSCVIDASLLGLIGMKVTEERPKQGWVIAQRWSHVLFLSYPVDPQLLQARLPEGLEVDTWEGSGWLSIVPFYMSGIRFRGLPSVPFTDLWELNLRTYVRWRDQRGILFFTLDTDSRLGQFVATRFFHLPYRVWKMAGAVEGMDYRFEAKDSFRMNVKLGKFAVEDPFDRWIADRYSLFTSGKRGLYRGDVEHEPWRLRVLDGVEFSDRFSEQFGFQSPDELHARYAEPLDVRFRPFVKLS